MTLHTNKSSEQPGVAPAANSIVSAHMQPTQAMPFLHPQENQAPPAYTSREGHTTGNSFTNPLSQMPNIQGTSTPPPYNPVDAVSDFKNVAGKKTVQTSVQESGVLQQPGTYIVVTQVHDQGLKPDSNIFYFSNEAIRRGFIKKVFAILAAQLLFTMALTCVAIFERNTKKFIQTHGIVLVVAFIIKIVVLLAIICFGELRRRTPINYILLIFFTVCKAYFVATLASFYDALAVAIALGFTVLICISLIVFAFQTKYDFTMMGGALFVTFMVFIMIGFTCIFLYNVYLQIWFAGIGALIFGIFIVYDVQLMIGGNHRYQLSPEEYIFAALNLFIDIVNLFIYILRIVGAR